MGRNFAFQNVCVYIILSVVCLLKEDRMVKLSKHNNMRHKARSTVVK